MAEQVIKMLHEITRKEYVLFDWMEIGDMGNEDRKFLKGQQRTPAEAAEAAEDWEIWQEAMNED